jgi:hypothetical protein
LDIALVMVGISLWKRPLGSPRKMWEDNIKEGWKIGCKNETWLELARDEIIALAA